VCVMHDCLQTFYGPALELLNEVRHVALVSDTFFLWSPYVIGQTIIFLPCDFFLLLLLLFFSSPNLSGRRLDVYRTSTHGLALVRI